MKPRLNPHKAAPDAIKAMLGLENYARNCGLEHSLIELVKTRASQINGCAYCIQMHTTDALKAGESHERLFLLDAWHEAPIYSERERAALAWTDALTRLADTHAPDDVYEALMQEFTEEDAVKLTLLIVAINGWNRIAVGFRAVPEVTSARAA